MKILDKIFKKYNSNEITSVEAQTLLHENHLVSEMSSVTYIINTIDSLDQEDNFQNTVQVCKITYLQYTTAMNLLSSEFSFRDYINTCFRTPRTLNNFNRKIVDAGKEKEFWSLVDKISSHLD